jgi:hypothetical protein
VTPLPRAAGTVPLVVAVDRFRDDPGTRTTYAETLTRLRGVARNRLPTGDLTPEVYEAVMARWGRQGREHVQQAPVRAETRSPGTPAGRNGSPPTPAGASNGARPPGPATSRSREPGSNGCSPTIGTRSASGCCGGCS